MAADDQTPNPESGPNPDSPASSSVDGSTQSPFLPDDLAGVSGSSDPTVPVPTMPAAQASSPYQPDEESVPGSSAPWPGLSYPQSDAPSSSGGVPGVPPDGHSVPYGAPTPGYPTPSGAPTPGYPAPGSAPAPGYPGPAGPVAYAPAPVPSHDGVSIAALVTGILGLAVVPLVLGIFGLRRTARNGTLGRGMAIAGVILGAIQIVSYIILGVVIGSAIVSATNERNQLYDGCAAGQMVDCDTLYFSSPISPNDVEFAGTCGGTSEWVGGSCERLAQLRDGCRAGSMEDCDSLFWLAPLGSDDVNLADSCNGQTVNGGGSCTWENWLIEPETPDGDTPDPGLDPAEPNVYGDHPEMDALWDACEAGDLGACDDLFYGSPFGSQYEEFGKTCGNRPEITGLFCEG